MIKAKVAGKEYKAPDYGLMGAEEAYDSVKDKLAENLNSDEITEDFLHEKSFEFERLVNKPETSKEKVKQRAAR